MKPFGEIFLTQVSQLPCPMCKAKSGQVCMNLESGEYVSPHIERMELLFKKKEPSSERVIYEQSASRTRT